MNVPNRPPDRVSYGLMETDYGATPVYEGVQPLAGLTLRLHPRYPVRRMRMEFWRLEDGTQVGRNTWETM